MLFMMFLKYHTVVTAMISFVEKLLQQNACSVKKRANYQFRTHGYIFYAICTLDS
jgi:hypothetical protein